MQQKTLHRRKRKYFLLILLLCSAGMTKLYGQIQGALNGVFSLSDTTIALFSQGNLQYQATTNTWRFAENQWDIVGYANMNVSSTYDGWIDLFG